RGLPRGARGRRVLRRRVSDRPSPSADLRLGAHVAGVLLSPRPTLRALASEASARSGASAVALLGLAWSVLLALLWSGGHAPSFVLVPIPRDLYYLAQAVLMLPLLTALWWLSSEIAHRICRAAGGTGTEGGTRAALGFAYAAPMLAAHVVPELVAFVAGGFEAMATVGRVTLGLASLWVWALSAAALRIAHGARVRTAVLASFAGLLAQALAGAVIIR